jgi:hypothetical protein
MRRYAAAVSLVVISCSGGEDRSATEQQVRQFHRLFNAQQFEAIYEAASPALRQQTPKAQFLDFAEAVHRKLGAVRDAKAQGWHVNYGTGGTHITLAYQTEFAQGTGTETFVYQSSGSEPRLVSYNINSNALVRE